MLLRAATRAAVSAALRAHPPPPALSRAAAAGSAAGPAEGGPTTDAASPTGAAVSYGPASGFDGPQNVIFAMPSYPPPRDGGGGGGDADRAPGHAPGADARTERGRHEAASGMAFGDIDSALRADLRRPGTGAPGDSSTEAAATFAHATGAPEVDDTSTHIAAGSTRHHGDVAPGSVAPGGGPGEGPSTEGQSLGLSPQQPPPQPLREQKFIVRARACAHAQRSSVARVRGCRRRPPSAPPRAAACSLAQLINPLQHPLLNPQNAEDVKMVPPSEVSSTENERVAPNTSTFDKPSTQGGG